MSAMAREVRNIVWASACLFHFVTIRHRPPHLTSALWTAEMRNFAFRLPWDRVCKKPNTTRKSHLCGIWMACV